MHNTSTIEVTATGHKRIPGNRYFYVPCQSSGTTNEGFEHYFRLYTVGKDGVVSLADQGLAKKVEVWESEYDATIEPNNPYPGLD